MKDSKQDETNIFRESKQSDRLIYNLLQDISNTDLTEDDIENLRKKMKLVDKTLKEKKKPKTITISGECHNKIKNYCSSLGLNIGDWVAQVLLKEIKDGSCIIVENGTDKEITEKRKSEISDNYIKSKSRKRNLIKSNKILFNKDFTFVGYSMVDSLPIYEVLNIEVLTGDNMYSKGVNYTILPSDKEVSKGILSNMNLEVEVF